MQGENPHPGGRRGKVFVSYGRGDDEPFVHRLVADLQPAIPVWWDRQAMESRGQTFLQVIRDAIATECDRVLLVVGPEAVASGYVRAEWEHALACCKAVVPVVRRGDATLLPRRLKDAGYNLIPAELALFHAPDFRDDAAYPRALDELRRVLGSVERIAGPTRGLPSEAAHFIARPELLAALRDDLMADLTRPVAIGAAQQTAALKGMGGIGKSVLAAAFARDCRTRRAFHDGIVWLAFGRRANALIEQARRLGEALHEPALAGVRDAAALASRLDDALRARACLVVLDDVWSADQAAPFVRAAAATRSRVLLTTRDAAIARALDAHGHRVGLLAPDDALRLLARAARLDVALLPPVAQPLADACGRLPLALALVGAMVRGKGADRWDDVLAYLQRADLDRLRAEFPDYADYPNLMAAIGASVEALPAPAAEAYLDLALLADDQRVPEAVLQRLWAGPRVDAAAVRERIDLLVDRSLLERDERGWLSLHDIQHDHLVRRCPDVAAVRRRLAAAYRDLCAGHWPALADDGFVHAHLVRLLADAGLGAEVHRLLLLEDAEAPAWYAVRARAGQAAGFRDDVIAARSMAAAEGERSLAAGEAAAALPTLIGYALMQASLGSLGAGLPPALWAAAVRDGLIDPAHALDGASMLPQLEPGALYRKCEVLLALAAACGEGLAAAAFGAALAAVEQAIDGGIAEDRWIAGPLALVVRRAPAAAVERGAVLASRLADPLAREQVMGPTALRWLELGRPEAAFEAAASVVSGAGPGYVVRGLAEAASAADWPAVRQAYAALDTAESRSAAAAAIAAATARHESPAAALAFVAQLDDETATHACVALAPALDGDSARAALAALAGRRSDLARLAVARAALALRLPDDERDPGMERLWHDIFRGFTKAHERAQRDLLTHVPPEHWPATMLDALRDDLDAGDDLEAAERIAAGLMRRGQTQAVIDGLEGALHSGMPSRAASLIAAAAPAADASALAAFADSARRIADVRQREIATAALIGRRAALGHDAVAWHELHALHDDYAHGQALRLVVPHLRGAAIEPALRELGRIGDDDEAAALLRQLAVACDPTPAKLVAAIDAGDLGDAQVAAQIAWRVAGRAESDETLLDALRPVADDGARASAQLALAAVPGHRSPLALAEAMLSIDGSRLLARLAPRLVPLLPLLHGSLADAMRERLADAARAWFDRAWDLPMPFSEKADAATLLAWCCGVDALAPALATASTDDDPFDRAYLLRIAALPFAADADRGAAAAGLRDLIANAANPYDTLIHAGNLSQLPAELLPALRQVIDRHCTFDHVRNEAADLALRAAALGEATFAETVAARLALARPEAAMALRVALAAHSTGPAERLRHTRAAAASAVRVVNPVNQVRRRGDILAQLVPPLLSLPRPAAAENLGAMLAALAEAPRAHLLLDLAALAPLFAALGDGAVEAAVGDAVARVRRWWP